MRKNLCSIWGGWGCVGYVAAPPAGGGGGGGGGFKPGRDRSYSKKTVTALLLNAREQMSVSRILEDDYFKRMTCVIVGVAR